MLVFKCIRPMSICKGPMLVEHLARLKVVSRLGCRKERPKPKSRSQPSLHCPIYRIFRIYLAEGARFELAVHEVDAGFQDRWFQPLTHPSDNDFSYLLEVALFFVTIFLKIC